LFLETWKRLCNFTENLFNYVRTSSKRITTDPSCSIIAKIMRQQIRTARLYSRLTRTLLLPMLGVEGTIAIDLDLDHIIISYYCLITPGILNQRRFSYFIIIVWISYPNINYFFFYMSIAVVLVSTMQRHPSTITRHFTCR